MTGVDDGNEVIADGLRYGLQVEALPLSDPLITQSTRITKTPVRGFMSKAGTRCERVFMQRTGGRRDEVRIQCYLSRGRNILPGNIFFADSSEASIR